MYIVRFLHQTTTFRCVRPKCAQLYIVRFLHQTTTDVLVIDELTSCISSVSYIKPQHFGYIKHRIMVVYRPFPTSNHNLFRFVQHTRKVVYRPFPTSNHNLFYSAVRRIVVVYRPFPTSNHNPIEEVPENEMLYIVRFLHQTTTAVALHIFSS